MENSGCFLRGKPAATDSCCPPWLIPFVFSSTCNAHFDWPVQKKNTKKSYPSAKHVVVMVSKQLWLSYNNAEENFSDSGEIVKPSRFWEHKQLPKKKKESNEKKAVMRMETGHTYSFHWTKIITWREKHKIHMPTQTFCSLSVMQLMNMHAKYCLLNCPHWQ